MGNLSPTFWRQQAKLTRPTIRCGSRDDDLGVVGDRHSGWLGRRRITLRSIRDIAIRHTASLPMQTQHDHIDWSWQGAPARLGVTRMGAGPAILMPPL